MTLNQESNSSSSEESTDSNNKWHQCQPRRCKQASCFCAHNGENVHIYSHDQTTQLIALHFPVRMYRPQSESCFVIQVKGGGDHIGEGATTVSGIDHQQAGLLQQQVPIATSTRFAPKNNCGCMGSREAIGGRAGVPMEVMGLMLGEFVDEYTVRVVDVFAMPQSGRGVGVEAVDHVFQTNMLDMLKQTGRSDMVIGSTIIYHHRWELGELASSMGICFHVDLCLGGFVLPFARKLGYPIPPFDFCVEGVTSISTDVHKYGLAPKGTSIILYRNHEIRKDDIDEIKMQQMEDEIKMQQMEELRKAYIAAAAVTTTKENQDNESVILAAKERLLLQSFVLGSKNVTNTMMQEKNCVVVS